MRLTIPIPEKISLNKIYAGVHWTIRSQHKDDFHFAVMSVNPKPYTGNYPARFHYHLKLHGKPLDDSNCFYLVKLVEDGLVSCGVIPDDNKKYVNGILTTSEKADKGGDEEVNITITDPT